MHRSVLRNLGPHGGVSILTGSTLMRVTVHVVRATHPVHDNSDNVNVWSFTRRNWKTVGAGVPSRCAGWHDTGLVSAADNKD